MIGARSLSYRYGSTPALADVSFEVDDDEVLAVMGANGAGKTTLLRLLAGLIEPDDGEIDRDGIVGFAPENPAAGLFAESVAAEVAFFPRNRGLDAATRADAAMRRFDVDALRDRDPHSLSRGEQRRVSLAAVLAGDPDVIAFDEPTAGLDRHSKDRLIDVLGDLDATLITSTHDAEFALAVADRVALLEGGTLVDVAPAVDLLAETERLESTGIRPLAAVTWAARNGLDRIPTDPADAAALLEETR